MPGAWWATATVAAGSVPLIASEHNGYEWNQEPPWAVMADVADRIDLFYGMAQTRALARCASGSRAIESVAVSHRWSAWTHRRDPGCHHPGSCSRAG